MSSARKRVTARGVPQCAFGDGGPTLPRTVDDPPTSGTDDALAVLRRMQPSLADSVYGAGDDDSDTPALVTQLAGQVGRVIIDGRRGV